MKHQRNSVVLGPTSEGVRYRALMDEDKSIAGAPVPGMLFKLFSAVSKRKLRQSDPFGDLVVFSGQITYDPSGILNAG